MFYFSRGEQVALALLIVALVGAAGAMWWASRAGEPSEPFFVDAPAPDSGEMVTVHVCGEVAKAGLYTIAAGSRIHQVIELAGGATERADLGAINLAREVVNGQQVYVPAIRPAASSPDAAQSSPPPASSSAPRKIGINGAGAEELERLPGIGPTYARRIVEFRERLRAETGQGFTRIEQLMEVPGIGPKRFADIKDRVTL